MKSPHVTELLEIKNSMFLDGIVQNSNYNTRDTIPSVP